MRRDPSLHITKSVLVQLLNNIQYTAHTTGIKLADMIFDSAQPHQIRDRYLDVLAAKGKTREKLVKSQTVDSEITAEQVEVFHKLLIAQRMAKDFAKAKPIGFKDRDYILLKEVALKAYQFTEHFEISVPQEGLLEYITLGLKFMGKKYGLNKFKTYDRRIYDYFDAYVLVLSDTDKEGTAEFYQIWKEIMLSHDTMMESTVDIEYDYIKYSSMVYGRMEADDMKAEYEDWITAQFDGLKFLNVIPELGGFHGENAKNRYNRYMNDSVAVDDDEDTDDITKLYKKENNG